jgi:uncharacterized protein involved in exopolysaccharide biosynthesis
MQLDPESVFVGFIGGIFFTLLLVMFMSLFDGADPGGPI